MNKHFTELNHQLTIIQDKKDIPIGLFSGKMGLCIYFYYWGRIENDEKYAKIAEKLIDEIFEQIEMVNSVDVENGLIGIALGINYLIKNGYVEGDENVILKDIEDKIFKQVSFNELNEDISVLIQILYYIRIRKQSFTKESNILFDELTIHIINNLHSRVEYIRDNKVNFNIDTKLPLFLFVLSEIYQVNIYNSKITRIICEITPFILSQYSYLDSKKLYLLWGVGKINKYVKDERLTRFCSLLASNIDISNLIDEFRNKNVFINDGISGICLLMLSLEDNEIQMLDLNTFYTKAIQKIENSLIWKLSIDPEYLKTHIGLAGYCGVAIILNEIKRL